jgi:cytochrome c2
MKKTVIIFSIALFTACSTTLLVPIQNDVERGKNKFSKLELSDLTAGKFLYEQHCGKCHSLKKAFKKTESEIENAMPRMAKRAKIDSTKQDLIFKYLITMRSPQSDNKNK